MRTLTIEELGAQHAVELPDREMMLITIVVSNNNIEILKNVDVDLAANVCGVLSSGAVTCAADA